MLSGIRSEHSKSKKDRKFYLNICTLRPCQYGMSCSFDMIYNNGFYGWNSTKDGKILDIFLKYAAYYCINMDAFKSIIPIKILEEFQCPLNHFPDKTPGLDQMVSVTGC